ncbi:MAG TPA: PVC-type heme-binding CxxCH protein, partial [Chitinophagaceae bacterium]|nr:PVC-type heme-binding CxxCH protein [Chitinophagaceae bacterium]
MRKKNLTVFIILLACFILTGGTLRTREASKRLEILFLGHKQNTNHNSELLADILSREFFKDGINISFTNRVEDLNEENLAKYDGLLVYANHDSISPAQEKALLSYVRGGKGFIPIHCASYSFRNSPEVVEMIGGQFLKHKVDSFSATILEPGHPVMKDVASFATRDETYVHHKISKNNQVLSERVEGDHHEPYTWVKSFGQGKVFYTAYGHDENTFNNKEFLKMVRNGILWAVNDKSRAELASFQLADPKYTEAVIPNYERRNPPPKYQEPLSAVQSMSLMQVPVGFELKLFASEPMVVNPIFMNWDERGRLWVIETVDYPNEVKDDDIGDDRIKIIEDTDGDGKGDKTTIFADKLNIPTSFVFVNGGIIVSAAPSFLFLKDTNGDDKADVRQNMLTGWGKRDTHAQASNLRYGPDNMIWGVVGYSGFTGKVDNEPDSLRFLQGLYKFTQDGKNLEFLSTTSNNTWGLGFSEEFDVFISTANNTHSGFYGIAKKYLDRAKLNESGIDKIDSHYGMHVVTKNLRQVDVPGGFTAAAGHSLYTARNFPKEYWNRIAFVCEPTGRLIHRHVVEQNGSGFKEGNDEWNILASADEWAGPVQAEVGPDGALWVVDWYDFIIQHNPTPPGFENGKGNAHINPLRDHDRGRIYRLVYKGNDQLNKLSLTKSEPAALVKALSNNNMFWRTTAQRLLVENADQNVLPDLYKLVEKETPDEIGINPAAIHALWTIHGLKALDGSNKEALAVATRALSHPSAGVRKAAIQVLPKTPVTFQAMQKAGVFNDKDVRVTLTAVTASSDISPSAQIGEVLVEVASRPEAARDSWLRYALTSGATVHQKDFAAAYKKKGLSHATNISDASFIQRLALMSKITAMPLITRRVPGVELEAPDVTGKELSITGNLEKMRDFPYQGLLVAHGDLANGYGVYLKDNKMYFQVNQAGKPYTVNSDVLPAGKVSFQATMLQSGMVSLTLNNKQVASTKSPGLFKQPLKTGIRVGFDDKQGNEKIADYPDTFRIRGALTNSKLETFSPGSPESVASSPKSKPTQVITLNVLKDVMKFDKSVLNVKAGTTVQIIVNNPDFMQHNFVLTKPNTVDKVGEAADKLAQDPN